MHGKRTATVEVWPTHRATLYPVVPEVRDSLLRRSVGFGAGGPEGHAAYGVVTDAFAEVVTRPVLEGDAAVRREYQVVPLGLVPDVVGLLGGLGYAVTVADHRTNSPRWRRSEPGFCRAHPLDRRLVDVLAEHRAVRVVGRGGGGDEGVARVVAAVARSYPEAAVAVGVPTHELLWRFRKHLGARFKDEPLGLYTSKKKTPARVSVGLIGQLPRGEKGEVDVLVLPYLEKTLGDAALRVVTSGRYRRVLSFSRSRSTGDGNLDRRVLVIAGTVWPPAGVGTPVTAVVLAAHGTRAVGKFEHALDEKVKLYWENGTRNRRIAEVARRLAAATKKGVHSVVGELGEDGDVGLAADVRHAAKAGVAVLVETPAHARELHGLLPGWAVWAAGDLTPEKPESGCGVIVTELAAAEWAVGAGVLVRAAGTRWGLPGFDWPDTAGVEHAFLVDFKDGYHPVALKNAEARVGDYGRRGMTVLVAEAAQARTGRSGRTGQRPGGGDESPVPGMM